MRDDPAQTDREGRGQWPHGRDAAHATVGTVSTPSTDGVLLQFLLLRGPAPLLAAVAVAGLGALPCDAEKSSSRKFGARAEDAEDPSCWDNGPNAVPPCCVRNFSWESPQPSPPDCTFPGCKSRPGLNFSAGQPDCKIGTTIPDAQTCAMTCERGYENTQAGDIPGLGCSRDGQTLKWNVPFCELCNNTAWKAGQGLQRCSACPVHTGTNRSGASSRASCAHCTEGYDGTPLPPVCVGAVGIQCGDQHDLDHKDGDSRRVSSAAECCERCRQNDNCGAWTWNGVDGADGVGPQCSPDCHCWLKSRCSNVKNQAGYTSGAYVGAFDGPGTDKLKAVVDCLYEQDTDCGQAGAWRVPGQVRSPAVCCKRCLNHTGEGLGFPCRAWTWGASDKTCWLKLNCDGKARKGGMISGGTCRGRTCPSRSPVANANTICPVGKYGDGLDNDTASICKLEHCKPGFEVKGDDDLSTFTCNSTGDWEGSGWCQGTLCSSVLPVKDATGTSSTPGIGDCTSERYSESEAGIPATKCSVTCADGYAPQKELQAAYDKEGSLSYSCQRDGSWSISEAESKLDPRNGLLCLKTCPSGFYGDDCDKKCDNKHGENMACNAANGSKGNPQGCNGCIYGGTCDKMMRQAATFTCTCPKGKSGKFC
eukprot:COSAG02_NODE_7532_length_2971_cov_1.966574_4_plen_647_part_01